MNKQTVYIENSIVSYLTARPSRQIVAAAWQRLTIDWWEARRHDFDLYTSELVLLEAKRGNPDAAKRRISRLESVPLLTITGAVEALALSLVEKHSVPKAANADAIHIAIAAVHGIDYLLTWNCTHIDNAETKPLIRNVCKLEGYKCPEICTPQELMGDKDGRNYN